MNRQNTLSSIILGATLLLTSAASLADRDEWEHRSYQLKGPGSLLYKNECGSCHIAYPIRFLGKESWQKMMQTLDNHFGENAELEPSEQQKITQFLLDHSTTSRWYLFWKNSDTQQLPLRITETRAFRHEHDEIPRSFISNNPKIRSLSQCDSCHINAEKGNFDEHQIRIPGIGRWEDD